MATIHTKQCPRNKTHARQGPAGRLPGKSCNNLFDPRWTAPDPKWRIPSWKPETSGTSLPFVIDISGSHGRLNFGLRLTWCNWCMTLRSNSKQEIPCTPGLTDSSGLLRKQCPPFFRLAQFLETQALHRRQALQEHGRKRRGQHGGTVGDHLPETVEVRNQKWTWIIWGILLGI